MALADALDELGCRLAESGSPLSSFLRPGKAAHQVVQVLANAGLKPPAAIVDLYGWHDGTDTDAFFAAGWRGPWLFPFATFRPLERAVWSYRRLLGMNVPAVEVWPRRLFPLFDQELLQYAVVCDPAAADHGQVWIRDLEMPEESQPVFSSLSSFVGAIGALFADGSYYFDTETSDIQETDDAYLVPELGG